MSVSLAMLIYSDALTIIESLYSTHNLTAKIENVLSCIFQSCYLVFQIPVLHFQSPRPKTCCSSTSYEATTLPRRQPGRVHHHDRFDSKIFESAHHFRIESNRAADSNSNRISKLRRSLMSTSRSVQRRSLLSGSSDWRSHVAWYCSRHRC